MAETWYRTRRLTYEHFPVELVPVEVLESSERFITVLDFKSRPCQVPIHSSYLYCYHRTRKEALAQLQEDSARLVARHEKGLALVRAQAEAVERLAAEVNDD
jgi:hypothetical protein